ncbi:eukaryotic translation initiation factor 3 subunit 3 [Polychaeton citri CBS 116435]|uniref:Eukaryotic translation initiation factor 3 subunit H n=1 Tax=Polychaeton citri CBS 116435 TaxID=1314669 RepID=A0A9P4QDI6_9PEZI|nr:eukaryotic translation initiation factor 3 subunit 3 [Polychaeton citri CBS 116435]
MRIIKHSTTSFPTPATGCLVGLDVGARLEVTNCFPYPANIPDAPAVSSVSADGYQHGAIANEAVALAAPRAKSSKAYETEMISRLKEVNVDAQAVGWYVSCKMGDFVTANFVENQVMCQRQGVAGTQATEGNGKGVALVFDVSRSSQGSLSLKAYRLSPVFMTAYKEGKFTTEAIQKHKLRFQDILVELPVEIHNSHLLTSFLHQLPTPPTEKSVRDFPASLAELTAESHNTAPLAPNLDSLDLSLDPFLEKTCDALLDSIEAHSIEQNNAQYYQRSLGREQAKIQQWQQKRKAENAARTASKQTLLDENEWQKLFKLPQEPSRLESLLVGRQVEQYARQIDGWAAGTTGKMFGVRGSLIPSDLD